MRTISLKLVAEEEVIEKFKKFLKDSRATITTQSRLVPNTGDSGFHQFLTINFFEEP